MTFTADLHVHSTASDGELSPSEVVAKAASLGIATIALTDHDTVDGQQEAQLAGIQYGVQVIAGIELSAEYKQSEVHVLGYFIQPNQGSLKSKLEQLQQSRHKRALEMVQKLQSLGINLNWNQVKKYLQGSVVGRPHIARALVDIGSVRSVQEAFELYLKKGRPAYVPRYKLSPQEAIAMIHHSKGAAVMAHPGQLPDLSYLDELLQLDWQGIEVFHPDHNHETILNLQQIAKKHNLVATGGSDYHGSGRKYHNLGAYKVSKDVVETLKMRCQF